MMAPDLKPSEASDFGLRGEMCVTRGYFSVPVRLVIRVYIGLPTDGKLGFLSVM